MSAGGGRHGERARTLGADAYFAIVPEWILWHRELSAGAVRLFGTLQRRTNEHDHAWPSRAWLADKIGVSKNTVDRYVGELVAAGAITKHRRADPETGEYTSTLYRLRMVSPHVGTPSLTHGATPSHVDGATVAPQMVTYPEHGDSEAMDTEPEILKSATAQAFRDEWNRRRAARLAEAKGDDQEGAA